MSEPLLLIGCGGHARSLIDVVESSDRWHVLGLVKEDVAKEEAKAEARAEAAAEKVAADKDKEKTKNPK